MKPYSSMKVWAAIALFSSSVLILSCGDYYGVPESDERKTMPLDSFEVAETKTPLLAKTYTFLGMKFNTELVSLQDGVDHSDFLSVQLNSETGETVLNLIKTVKPFMATYLKEWSAENKGIMLDLRNNPTETGEKEAYSLEKEETFAVPVIIRWDAGSASNAEEFKAALNNLPGITARKIIQENTNF
ncbi:hypothetical protein OQX61_23495 [Pedobacter sp. PLR]|uniref:hypothetical protein n=1 Tax=Pedobacter sp. PLR TaxID=2994465 RepID=UPI00224571B9|nr:hypothetical protein [Pedobacter sp. PLR]MCX2454256.1 hypothetical protein [Pedobacter sp. PLR]